MAPKHTLTPDQMAGLDQVMATAREVLDELVDWAALELDEEPDVSITTARVWLTLSRKADNAMRTGIAAVALVELARQRSSEAVG